MARDAARARPPLARTVLGYGGALAAGTWLLKYLEYRYLVRDFSLELVAGLVALMFAALGVWAGLRLTRPAPQVPPSGAPPDPTALARLGVSRREHEVLELIAQGRSNREIAARLSVSPHTVKTHSSSLFVKLGARRRTEAVSRAKALGLLP